MRTTEEITKKIEKLKENLHLAGTRGDEATQHHILAQIDLLNWVLDQNNND